MSDSTLTARLLSIQVGMPCTIGQNGAANAMDDVWTTGFFKSPVAGQIRLSQLNLDGDGQADLVNHGGPEKAVNVYPVEHYHFWAETQGLSDLSSGAFGENFTTSGILESDVCIGDVFRIGDAVVQISQPRQPCWKLSRRWRLRDLALRVQETGRTGWYFRVLREGTVEAGAPLILTERSYPEWTVSAANDVMHKRTQDIEAARTLMNCHLLAVRWRDALRKRIATGNAGSNTARLLGRN